MVYNEYLRWKKINLKKMEKCICIFEGEVPKCRGKRVSKYKIYWSEYTKTSWYVILQVFPIRRKEYCWPYNSIYLVPCDKMLDCKRMDVKKLPICPCKFVLLLWWLCVIHKLPSSQLCLKNFFSKCELINSGK